MNEDDLYPLELRYNKDTDNASYIITEQSTDSENEQEVVEYERHVHSLGITVENLMHFLSFNTAEEITKDYKGTGKWNTSTRNRLSGEGILIRGDNRPDTISIFGGKNRTSKIGVEIHVRPDEVLDDVFSFSAYKEIQSYEINNEEAYFLSLYLSKERFVEIAELVRTQSIDDFFVDFDAGALNSVFARPSYFSESQNFKYLSNVNDIVNKNDVPDDFIKREDVAEFEITIVKNSKFYNNKMAVHQGKTINEELEQNNNPKSIKNVSIETKGKHTSPPKVAENKWLARLVYSIWAIAIIFIVLK